MNSQSTLVRWSSVVWLGIPLAAALASAACSSNEMGDGPGKDAAGPSQTGGSREPGKTGGAGGGGTTSADAATTAPPGVGGQSGSTGGPPPAGAGGAGGGVSVGTGGAAGSAPPGTGGSGPAGSGGAGRDAAADQPGAVQPVNQDAGPFVYVDYTKQTAVTAAWNAEFDELGTQIQGQSGQGTARRNLLKEQALDPQALVQTTDKDGLDVILRRTTALLQYYKTKTLIPTIWITDFESKLSPLADKAKSTTDATSRKDLFRQVAQVRRNAEFANSLLNFDSIAAQLEQPGDARMVEQALARNGGHQKGGGPIIIKNFKSNAPQVTKALEGVTVSAGAYQGKQLTGKFQGFELSYDGNELFFASTTSNDVFHLFNFNLTTKKLTQLTDGADDDMDPVELPSGRIAFTSTRRGGIGRCVLVSNSVTYTLFGAERDGTDIIPLSYHETNEWQPSVDNAGKLVYTRWDYLDRWWGTAHHLWLSYPDGRDARNWHGNYPIPLDVMDGVTVEQYGKVGLTNGRNNREDVTMSLRAVENSTKYVAAAVGHHEGFSGSLVLVDPTIPDDHKMSQVKRVAPEYAFPEVEGGKHVWGTPWPLSEDFYLVNFNQSLVLLDRFGNREVIYEGTSPYRVRDPFPLRPRTKPPVLTVMTWQGKRASLPDHARAVVSVINVYEGDMPLPQGMKAKWLRINQLVPSMTIKTCCSFETIYYVGFSSDTTPRMSLGIVPVESDGSVYFEAPVEKALYFQLLDENGFAIQSMRSVTYVHPGENLQCMGCHEDKWKAVPITGDALALKRAPSQIVPEVDSGAMPMNFYRLVKTPVFDKKCVPCHTEKGKGPDMTYDVLAPRSNWKWAFGYPGETELNHLGVGGSRTTPGKFGAQASGLMRSLNTKDYHKDVWSSLTADERKRITLWLDMNSMEIGWQSDTMTEMDAQRRGELVWPPIDVDPKNPIGTETDYPLR